MSRIRNILTIILLFLGFSAFGQDEPVDFVIDQAQNQEIYVHFDKPFYVSGETMWFSIYNYRADDHQLIFGRRFMELALIDRNRQVIKKERIRVVDGRSAGQLVIPDYTASGNYMFLITYPFEDAENFLYRKIISIYNPNDDQFFKAPLTNEIQDTLISAQELPEVQNLQSYLAIQPNKESYSRREPITVTLDLDENLTAKASVVVRAKSISQVKDLDVRSIALNPTSEETKRFLTDVELSNFRENKALNWKLVDSHGLLLYELIQKDSADDSTIPYLYIPEDRTSHSIFEVRPNQYVFDATGLSGDQKSLYFSSFTFGTWGAESKGALKFDWIYRRSNYNNILPSQLTELPESSLAISNYLLKSNLRKRVLSAYGSNLSTDETELDNSSGLRYRTAIWKNADDYTQMSSVPEFLREIVMGLKIWDRRKKFDIRLNYVGGSYLFSPFFLVNGVPTWDHQRVLEIPMPDVYGIGVIKDLQTETGQARDARAELTNFGYFGSSGILSIELRPGVTNPFQSEFNQLLKRRFYLASQEFKTPTYTQSTLNSYIPDFRPVLYWNPDVVFGDEGQPKISFFASDDSGEYEIIVEGIGKNGEIIYANKTITIGTTPDN